MSRFISRFPRLHNMIRGVMLLVMPNSYLRTTGYLRSILTGWPCRVDGSPLPWMNFPVITFFDQRLNSRIRLFEYGSGYSSLYYAAKVEQVVSVEHHTGWYYTMLKKVPPNLSLRYVPLQYDGDYCRAIVDENALFDVVIVDGRDRVRCLEHAATRLSDKGVIVLDDSQRPQYARAFEIMLGLGFRSLDFEGLKPCGYQMERSTIFYRDNNCLGL